MREASDIELLSFLKDEVKKQAAFFELVSRYKQRIYFYTHRILESHEDADDATQNTFIKLFENASKFEGRSALYTWLYKVAHREALGILRKRKQDVPAEDALNMEGSILNFDGDRIAHALWSEVMDLPKKQQRVFQLKYYDELSYEEISAITGTSIGALKANYHHAVLKLKEKFSGID